MMKKITSLLLLLLFFGIHEAQAQKSLGVSFENRSEEPQTGIGLHFQNDFTVVPMLLKVGVRLQGSFYSENYNLREDDLVFDVDDTSYDFGLGAIATLSAGLVAPYAGAGLGYEIFDRESAVQDLPGTPDDLTLQSTSSSDNGLYYYGTVGVGISAIPVLRPYVEYRYRGVTSTDFMPSKYGVWAFGMQLRF